MHFNYEKWTMIQVETFYKSVTLSLRVCDGVFTCIILSSSEAPKRKKKSRLSSGVSILYSLCYYLLKDVSRGL